MTVSFGCRDGLSATEASVLESPNQESIEGLVKNLVLAIERKALEKCVEGRGIPELKTAESQSSHTEEQPASQAIAGHLQAKDRPDSRRARIEDISILSPRGRKAHPSPLFSPRSIVSDCSDISDLSDVQLPISQRFMQTNVKNTSTTPPPPPLGNPSQLSSPPPVPSLDLSSAMQISQESLFSPPRERFPEYRLIAEFVMHWVERAERFVRCTWVDASLRVSGERVRLGTGPVVKEEEKAERSWVQTMLLPCVPLVFLAIFSYRVFLGLYLLLLELLAPLFPLFASGESEKRRKEDFPIPCSSSPSSRLPPLLAPLLRAREKGRGEGTERMGV